MDDRSFTDILLNLILTMVGVIAKFLLIVLLLVVALALLPIYLSVVVILYIFFIFLDIILSKGNRWSLVASLNAHMEYMYVELGALYTL